MLTRLTPTELATALPPMGKTVGRPRGEPAALIMPKGRVTLNVAAMAAIGAPRRILVAADGRGLIIAPAAEGDARAYSLVPVSASGNGRTVRGITAIPVAVRMAGLMPVGQTMKCRAQILVDGHGKPAGLFIQPGDTLPISGRRRTRPAQTESSRVLDLPELMDPDSPSQEAEP